MSLLPPTHSPLPSSGHLTLSYFVVRLFTAFRQTFTLLQQHRPAGEEAERRVREGKESEGSGAYLAEHVSLLCCAFINFVWRHLCQSRAAIFVTPRAPIFRMTAGIVQQRDAGKAAMRKASLAGFDFGLAYCELGASRCWLSLLLLLFVSSNFGRTWQTIYQTKYALEIVQGNYEYPAHSLPSHTHTVQTANSVHFYSI